MEKLSNTEPELKESFAYKKSVYLEVGVIPHLQLLQIKLFSISSSEETTLIAYV